MSELATINPTFQDVSPRQTSQFETHSWFTSQAANGVPEHVAPSMLAQGYEVGLVNRVVVGGTSTNPIFGYTYGLTRTEMNGNAVLGGLLTEYVAAYNEGRDHNQKRYEDLLTLFTEMLDKSQSYLTESCEALNARLALHQDTIEQLDSDYADFFVDVQRDLDDLTVTLNADRTRVNDQFDAEVSNAQQALMNRGFYSSAMWETIQAGIEERRQLQLTEISEREQRLIAEITLRKNEIYRNVLQMRSGLIEQDMALTNRDQQFREYQLATRNQIVVQTAEIVQGREDDYPGLGQISEIAVALGETGRSQLYVN